MRDPSIATPPSSRRRAWLPLAAVASLLLPLAVARADVAVPGARAYTTISGGSLHTCAVLYNGHVACWGSNALEQLGAAADQGLPDAGMPPTGTEDQPQPILLAQGTCQEDVGGQVTDEGVDCLHGACSDGGVCECTSLCPGNSTCVSGLCVPQSCAGSPPTGFTCSGGSFAPIAGPVPTVPLPTRDGQSWPAVGNVVAVASGDAHTCVLAGGPGNGTSPGGAVWCWGEGSAGQLGNGSYNASSIPQQVSGIGVGTTPPAVAIASGANHACAVLVNGTVQCWGDNNQGQLGVAVGPRSNTPVEAFYNTHDEYAVAVAAGAEHTCVIQAGGYVGCWGGNYYGQVGVGTSGGAHITYANAQSVTLSGYAVAIAAGRLHTCALVVEASSTAVQCWGDNLKGQLGNGTTTPASSPVTVFGLSGVRSISAGGDHTCALLANGAVECWGDNGDGETGNGTSGQAGSNNPVGSALYTTAPAAVSGLSCATSAQCARAITSGYFHNCAVLGSGATECWGAGEHSQIGNNQVVEQNTPAATNLGALVSIGAQMTQGGFSACTLLASGGAECWGDGANYQLDDGTPGDHTTPTYVQGLPYSGNTSNTPAISMCQGDFFTCALLVNGQVDCWGDNSYGQTGNGVVGGLAVSMPNPVTMLGTALQITCGGYHACALIDDGTLRCWGRNTYGELGDGSTTTTGTPQTVSSLGWATQVAAGGYHTCAISGGSAYCWGYNAWGQLGNSAYPSGSSTPVAVSSLGGNLRSLGIGYGHSCALSGNGTASCWGLNNAGQLGDGNTGTNATTPVSVSNGFAWAAIGGGEFHTCGLTAAGLVQCWGNAVDGELGDNSTTPTDVPPDAGTGVQLDGGAVVTSAAALGFGLEGACALRTDGTVYCWGDNSYGEDGNGTATTQYDYAVGVSGLPTDGGT
jgi:alpha-tubulin suppressor-like RCC1 family protein